MAKLSPAARKVLRQMKTQEKEMLLLRVKNPIAATKYIAQKYGVKVLIAKQIVDSFR